MYFFSFAATCPSLSQPENGAVSLNGTRTVATYFCDDGFELAGNSTRICEEDDTWSGEAPTCARKEIAAD